MQTTIVPDTNLFYAGTGALAKLAAGSDTIIAPSLISALEILCAERDSGLQLRQRAATNWLNYAGNAVVDNEVGHAVNLGFAAPPNYIDSFVEALEPFKNLPDTSQSSQQRVGLDLSAAIVAKQDASARFVGKVATLLSAYKARVQGVSELLGERIKHAVSHDESVVRPILESFRGEVEQMHLIRIDEVATDLQLAGSNSGDVNLISNYVDLYIEFVILKLTEGAAQINDYIDLQFFAYLDLGYVFASKENKWKELAERTKKSNGFISVDN